MNKYEIQKSGTRKDNAFFSRTAFALEGTLIAKFKIMSDLGTSSEVGRSTALNINANIQQNIDNARIQAVFSHFERFNVDWKKYYNSSDDLTEDIGDDISAKLIDYNIEYNTFNDNIRYKYINVKGKKYLQIFKKSNSKYVFSQRFAVKDTLKDTRNKLKVWGGYND